MIETINMFVIKRTGVKEPVAFEKVQDRITKAAEGLAVNAVKVAQGVLTRMIDCITTTELDTIAANLAFSWSTTNPDYATLAARIAISNHQRNTPATMLEVVDRLDAVLDRTGHRASILDPAFVACVRKNADAIEAHIDYSRDYLLDFFGFKTLERAYLLRDTQRKVIERPQHLWMRVALGIWPNDLPRAFEMYDMMSQKKYTHATPTLFNAGTKRPQLSSCFLLAIKDNGDCIHGIYDTLKDCALISQYGGGIGIHISNIRARGSLIRGTGGTSNGIVPMLRVYNNTARYVDQCFVPETFVATEEGAKYIKDVQAGERIQTSQGFRRVNALVEHDWSGPMLRVTMHQETPGGTAQLTVQVTAEHPVLALQNIGGDTAELLEAKYRAGLVELDYIELGSLHVGDLVASPSSQDSTQLSFHSIESMEETEYTGKLYDFEVDAPHDYHVLGLGIAHNGGGKRNGSFAIYLEPWHADVEDFLDMKKNTGAEEERARDLFYGLWVPDLFMERVDAGADWTLFCPNEAPGLADVVGPAFKTLYERYETEGRGRKTVKAQDLWFRILDSQIETGTPYLLYKDAANLKSNQQNLGVIKSSNLCVAPETLVLTDKGQVPIRDIAGQTVKVWNGTQWSEVIPRQTGVAQTLCTVHVQCNRFSIETNAVSVSTITLSCTPYHKFLLEGSSIQTAVRVDAKDLVAGQHLMSWHSPDAKEVIWYYVDAVEYEGRIDDTYCFNESLNHAGVFNGILTGNCTEIIEYSSPEETAVCNLASLSLPAFVKDGAFDFADFRRTVKSATVNLNRVIDVNYYPIPEAKRSNMRHRPIGLGVQGLADVFAMLNIAWDDPAAANLNRRIFAHMYYAACEASCDLAAKEGSYETWLGSPAQLGKLQFDLWGVEPEADPALDWDGLVNSIRRIGMRNSLLVAPMPTASTSQILGNCECIEPYATHIFTRRTLAGEFIIVNRHLVKALQEAGIWNDTVKDRIVANNGSVQGLPEVPEAIQRVFKTVWEIKQKILIDMAADRGPYVCQSQSLNLFLADPDYRKLTSMHFYAWRRGLKTGIYYLRTRAAASAQKFTVDPTVLQMPQMPQEPKECLMCSS
jgi:ribonucleotide reductase alpha subunit